MGIARAEEAATTAAEQLARQILDATGIQGGLIVHLGCGDGRLTAALQATPTTLVHGLDGDAANVKAARRHIRSLGLYGKVSAEHWAGGQLPYIDNLVNLLVAEDANAVPMTEVMRVLAPHGVAYIKRGGQWQKTVKPRPKEIDEWTHYLHDPSNNAVAHDATVGPPRHLQWTCGPAWSRHHDHMASLSALVSSAGRVFYIQDEGPRESILLPSQWSLIARDAFNGTILWKRPIAEWNTQLWPLKSGPNQLPRRLVAVGGRVYVTLGIDAPAEILDAATGRTLRTCPDTDHTDEVLVSDGTLFLLVAHGPNKWKTYRPKSTFVWANTGRANKEWAWDGEERSIMAVDAESSALRWKLDTRVVPLTLALDSRRVVFYDSEKVVALDRRTGKKLWTSERIVRKAPFPTGYGPTLVLADHVVLLSIESSSMHAFSVRDGKRLWSAPHHRGGHASPDDMLVVGGLVWSADVADGNNTGMVTGRDLHTGEVGREFLPDVHPDWFHHRCYRSRATDKYFIASRTGIEFIDLEAQHWDINHWVRGGCLYGFMPANGMVYSPAHSCGCFLESKLFGFNALAAESPGRKVPEQVSTKGRFERGADYAPAAPFHASLPSPSDWPTYRHDAARSGADKFAVDDASHRLWNVKLEGKLSSVTVAGGKVFVAAVDAHTVHALDAASGKTAWSYTAGGRVDSPPTIDAGRVFFGSADGWVYCLRAEDGRLVWRFRAAPSDRRMMAGEQLESAWPVSGSVLVCNGAVCCIAGRSAFLDGGMRLVRLDAASGRLLSETRIDDRDPATGENLQSLMRGQDMPVALPDILSCDGTSIYMRAQAFDLEGRRRQIAPIKLAMARRGKQVSGRTGDLSEVKNHLFSRSGFLDQSWFWRSYWIFGREVDGNYGGWLRPGHFAPCGRLMVFDEGCVYGFDRKPEYLCNASVADYYVYRADREVTAEAVARVQAGERRIDAASSNGGASASDWATRKKFPLWLQSANNFHWARGGPPIHARAMVLAGRTLYVAGPPVLVDDEAAFRNPDNPAVQARLAAQVAALRGQGGGQVLAVSADDGKVLAAYELGAVATFDGMAAAEGRLYLTTRDGRVMCLGGEGEALPAAAPPKLVPLDTIVKPLPPMPPSAARKRAGKKAAGPSLAGDFDHVARAAVTKSDLGYYVLAEEQAAGVVLKKLTEPLSGRVELKTRMRITADGNLQNGFIVFGGAAQEDQLVRCGVRAGMSKAMILQEESFDTESAAVDFTAPPGRTVNIAIAVDLPGRKIKMTIDGATVEAPLARPLKSITHVGYCVLNAAAEFSRIDVGGK